MPLTDQQREDVRREAMRLAQSQGLNWDELPQDRRRELKDQVRATVRSSGQNADRQ